MVSNHDELMCNFFAQADALAKGKSAVELRAENVPDHLIPHKTFTGNRPSLSILLPELNAFTTGQILAMYEHRVAVQVCTSLNRADKLLKDQHELKHEKINLMLQSSHDFTGWRLLNPYFGFLKQANHDIGPTALTCTSRTALQDSSLQQEVADLVSSSTVSAVTLLLVSLCIHSTKSAGRILCMMLVCK